jgi:hypothetical protein
MCSILSSVKYNDNVIAGHISNNKTVLQEERFNIFDSNIENDNFLKYESEYGTYKEKVDIEVIEAFNSKCKDIPEIHKGIIVSSNGFTAGAQTKAQFYGIDLYQIGDVPLKKIFNSVDLFYTQCKVEMAPQYRAILENDNPTAPYSDNGIFKFLDNNEVEMVRYLVDILRNHIPSMLPSLQNYLYFHSKKIGDIPLIITPPDKLYVLDILGNKHIVTELQVFIRVTFNMELQNIEKQSLYVNTFNDTSEVRISEYTKKDGEKILLIHGKNILDKAFVKDADGNFKETVLVPLKSKSL